MKRLDELITMPKKRVKFPDFIVFVGFFKDYKKKNKKNIYYLI